MHKPTLIKLAAGIILIVLVVIATFWYGNAQRATQLKKRSSEQPTQQQNVQLPSADVPSVAPQNAGDAATNKNGTSSPAPAPQPNHPATPPAQPAAEPAASMPSTGGEASIIPLTILATLSYMYFRSRKTSLYK